MFDERVGTLYQRGGILYEYTYTVLGVCFSIVVDDSGTDVTPPAYHAEAWLRLTNRPQLPQLRPAAPLNVSTNNPYSTLSS